MMQTGIHLNGVDEVVEQTAELVSIG